MRCFSHPEVEAAGICSHCGRAGCRECLHEVGRVLLCGRCAAAPVAAPDQAGASPGSPSGADAVEQARRRIRWSWRVARVVGGLGFVGMAAATYLTWTDPGRPPLAGLLLMSVLGGVMYGYVAWGIYWGVPPIWRWAYQTVRRLAGAGKGTNVSLDVNGVVVLLFALYIFVVWIPILAGIAYGVLGGGVHQYLRHRRLAAGGEAAPAAAGASVALQ